MNTLTCRQNSISVRWNSDEPLLLWRKEWADAVNQSLARSGIGEHINHRSHAARGLDEQPTIHDGVIAQALEHKGIISDWWEFNRQTRADNALLRELKAQDSKNIATMRTGLKKLEQQEQKYTTKLDNALKEYFDLKEQALEFDTDELMSERFATRSDKERSAVSHMQSAYGDRYQPLMMYNSKRDVSEIFGEETEVRSIRERLRRKKQPQTQR